MMSLVKRVAFTKWAPQGIFVTKSIFRHGDHISEVVGSYLWMVVQFGKIDGFLFLDILGEVYL